MQCQANSCSELDAIISAIWLYFQKYLIGFCSITTVHIVFNFKITSFKMKVHLTVIRKFTQRLLSHVYIHCLLWASRLIFTLCVFQMHIGFSPHFLSHSWSKIYCHFIIIRKRARLLSEQRNSDAEVGVHACPNHNFIAVVTAKWWFLGFDEQGPVICSSCSHEKCPCLI